MREFAFYLVAPFAMAAVVLAIIVLFGRRYREKVSQYEKKRRAQWDANPEAYRKKIFTNGARIVTFLFFIVALRHGCYNMHRHQHESSVGMMMFQAAVAALLIYSIMIAAYYSVCGRPKPRNKDDSKDDRIT